PGLPFECHRTVGGAEDRIELPWTVNDRDVEGHLELPALRTEFLHQPRFDGRNAIALSPFLARLRVDRERTATSRPVDVPDGLIQGGAGQTPVFRGCIGSSTDQRFFAHDLHGLPASPYRWALSSSLKRFAGSIPRASVTSRNSTTSNRLSPRSY